MCENQAVQNAGFASVSLATQRLQSSALAAPIRQISRTVSNSAQRLLQSSGQQVQRQLANVSHRIAGPIAFKLHHDFLMSKEDNVTGLLVGGSSLGYPRARHSKKVQTTQGGSRQRVNKGLAPVNAKIQGGRSTKPTKNMHQRTTTLPGGRGLGNRSINVSKVVSSPIPSTVRFVKKPSAYHVSQSQGGKIQAGIPLTIKGRKNLPGGANLGNKQQASKVIFKRIQGGVGLSLAKKDVLNVSQIVKSARQGGSSLKGKAVTVERSGMLGGAGLGKKDKAAQVIPAPVLGGMTLGHRHVVHDVLVAPAQGGSTLTHKQF
eukprot:TRINITY_DN29054_c1_g1_i2.p1 TRINITY_DN29054_c1_g1~~TRINITY_DN29054_c1_g1_i2.p1  ORF type:complete len:359 (+),score=50.82 TRINITY_DN29054_c1_g1_i2:126-1079(+)